MNKNNKKQKKYKNMKKRDLHQTLRIQAKIGVFIKNNKQKQKNVKKPKVKNHDFSGFWAHFGRAKVIQNGDFLET